MKSTKTIFSSSIRSASAVVETRISSPGRRRRLFRFIQKLTPKTSVNLTRMISLWRIAYLAHSSDAVEVLIPESMSRSGREHTSLAYTAPKVKNICISELTYQILIEYRY